MDWRKTMLGRCGPGVLSGVALRDWVRLLRHGGLAFDLRFLPRVCLVTFQALKNTLLGSIERRRFNSLLESVVIQPPLFILGHWRNGTTLLHNLLAQDPRFAFPNSYQTAFPHIFLTTEAIETRLLSTWIPRTRPMDNMDLSLAAPQEDEFAICASTLISPCMAWVLPRQKEGFEKYLSLRDVTVEELRVWREALLLFLRKLQWRDGRPLVLKSPPHTARVRLLLTLFPEPPLRQYVRSLAGYRKNVLPDLAPDLRARIAHEWKPFFREWGYPP